MAQIVATCSYLKDIIGLGTNQEGTDRAKKITTKELTAPANLVKLVEDDGVKILFQNIRKPSGTEP